MEHDFTGVVAPDVTENEKIGPKNRADDIKNDEYYGHEIEMYTVEQGEKRDKRQ